MQSFPGYAQPSVRRAFLAAALMLAANVGAAADSPIKSMETAYDGETYVLKAVMAAPVPLAVAWDVLTDFDNMEKWIPNVIDSKVVKREGAAVTVEQRGTAKFGLLSFPFTTERKIDLAPPGGIKTMQLKGSMRRVESSLKLESDGKGTRINYHLEVVPAGAAAAVMSKKFLEHEIDEQFSAIVGEMVRRAK
jgi:carbon monoxide dehydrogenase subunit G